LDLFCQADSWSLAFYNCWSVDSSATLLQNLLLNAVNLCYVVVLAQVTEFCCIKIVLLFVCYYYIVTNCRFVMLLLSKVRFCCIRCIGIVHSIYNNSCKAIFLWLRSWTLLLMNFEFSIKLYCQLTSNCKYCKRQNSVCFKALKQ